MPRCCRVLLLCFVAAYARSALAQEQLGKIIGQIRVDRGDFPPHGIFVELQLRFSTINSVYADSQGRFGFYNLDANSYHILIRDDAYLPVDELATIDPLISPTAMLQITLRPRPEGKVTPIENRAGGSNPYMIGLDEYRKHFPKSALKEFDKGLRADQDGKKDDAIAHYERVLKVAPGFYPAHNNLGSDYLNKADLDAARREFEEVVRLNQSDAAAYFNLSNVYMLTGRLQDSEQFLGEGMRREPESAIGFVLRGSLDMRTGRYQEAEGALRRAVRISPVMAQARLQLINLLLKLRRNSEAKVELRSFIDTFPDNSFTSQAKELLHRLERPVSAESHN